MKALKVLMFIAAVAIVITAIVCIGVALSSAETFFEGFMQAFFGVVVFGVYLGVVADCYKMCFRQ